MTQRTNWKSYYKVVCGTMRQLSEDSSRLTPQQVYVSAWCAVGAVWVVNMIILISSLAAP